MIFAHHIFEIDGEPPHQPQHRRPAAFCVHTHSRRVYNLRSASQDLPCVSRRLTPRSSPPRSAPIGQTPTALTTEWQAVGPPLGRQRRAPPLADRVGAEVNAQPDVLFVFHNSDEPSGQVNKEFASHKDGCPVYTDGLVLKGTEGRDNLVDSSAISFSTKDKRVMWDQNKKSDRGFYVDCKRSLGFSEDEMICCKRGTIDRFPAPQQNLSSNSLAVREHVANNFFWKEHNCSRLNIMSCCDSDGSMGKKEFASRALQVSPAPQNNDEPSFGREPLHDLEISKVSNSHTNENEFQFTKFALMPMRKSRREASTQTCSNFIDVAMLTEGFSVESRPEGKGRCQTTSKTRKESETTEYLSSIDCNANRREDEEKTLQALREKCTALQELLDILDRQTTGSSGSGDQAEPLALWREQCFKAVLRRNCAEDRARVAEGDAASSRKSLQHREADCQRRELRKGGNTVRRGGVSAEGENCTSDCKRNGDQSPAC